jgi:hypothetical protein
MSRPYININSASYNTDTDVITLDILALRLRGQSELSIGGFTQSKTLSLTNGYYSTAESGNYYTFSANINGVTASGNATTATYTSATAVFEFSGTASGPGATATNLKMTLWGLNGASTANFVAFGTGGYTFSSTQDTATAVQNLANYIITSGSLPDGVTATSSENTVTLTATTNTGAFYNGNPAKIESSSLGTLGFTFSSSYYTGVWANGLTSLTIPVSTTNFGELESLNFDIS